MTTNEKQELANLLESMGVSHRDTLNRDTLTTQQYENAQLKFRETYFETLTFVDNIQCSDDNTPHNFTSDNQAIEAEIEKKSTKKARLTLAFHSQTSLMLDLIDELFGAFPDLHVRKLKQVGNNYRELLEVSVTNSYALVGENQLHFSQHQNLMKLGNSIFIQAITDDKAHEFLSFLVAFANGECKYEENDKQFLKEDVEKEAVFYAIGNGNATKYKQK